jgi:hypothetical protein
VGETGLPADIPQDGGQRAAVVSWHNSHKPAMLEELYLVNSA